MRLRQTAPDLPRSAGTRVALLATLLLSVGCASDQARFPAPVVPTTLRPGFGEAGETFAARGVQPGERLPVVWMSDLDGRPLDLRSLAGARPTVLVTASISSPASRRSQAGLELLLDRWGDRVDFVVVYTVEAHPRGAASPYSGNPWMPRENIEEGIAVRQPTILLDRRDLAQQYARLLDVRARVVVDAMDDAAWRALGMAPNLGLLVDERGVVVHRQGWFDDIAMDRAVAALLGAPPLMPEAEPGSAPEPDDGLSVAPPGLAPELAALLGR